jgi:hypothetical protein
VIETVFRVRCSGPCGRYLSDSLTHVTEYPSREDAATAAAGVKWTWISRLDHAYKAGWTGPDSCCRSLPLVGYMRGYCGRPIADHADDGPFCPECAPGALSERRAAQEAWWAAEVQRRAVAAGEG